MPTKTKFADGIMGKIDSNVKTADNMLKRFNQVNVAARRDIKH